MADPVTITITAKDDASDVLAQINGELAAAPDATEDASKSMEGLDSSTQQASSSADELSGSVSDLHPAALLAAAGLAAGTAAVIAFREAMQIAMDFVGESIDAWREQRAVLRDLERAFRGVGVEGQELKETIAELRDVSNEFASETLFSNEQVEEAISTYQRVAPEALSVAEATEDMSTILGLAESRGISAARAAEIFGRAAGGQTRRIDRLTSLTRGQVTELSNIEDSSERARVVTDALRREYEGAASQVDQVTLAQSRAENAMDDIRKTIGEAILESESMGDTFGMLADRAEALSGWIKENDEAIQDFASSVGTVGVAAMLEATEQLEEMGQGFRDLNDVLSDSTGLTLDLAKSIEMTARISEGFFSSAGRGIPILGEFGDALAAVSGFTADVSERFRELEDDRKVAEEVQAWADSWDELNPLLLNTNDALIDILSSTEGMTDGVGEATNAWGALIEKMEFWQQMAKDVERTERQEQIARLRLSALNEEDEIEAARLNKVAAIMEIRERGLIAGEEELAIARERQKFGERREQILTGEQREREQRTEDMWEQVEAAQRESQIAAEQEERRLRQIEDEERRNDIAALRMELLIEEDELRRAELAQEIGLLEINEERLTDKEQELALLEVEDQFKRELFEIEEEARQEELEHAEAMDDLRENQISQLERQLGGVGQLGNALRQLRDDELETAEATDLMISAFDGLANAGGQLSRLVTDDREEAAKIEAQFNAAAATAAFAGAIGFGRPELAIAGARHTAAAAQFGAVGGRGSSGPGGGGGGRSGAQDIRRREQEQQIPQSEQPRINFDFSGNVNLEDSDTTASRITDTVTEELSSRGIGPTGGF